MKIVRNIITFFILTIFFAGCNSNQSELSGGSIAPSSNNNDDLLEILDVSSDSASEYKNDNFNEEFSYILGVSAFEDKIYISGKENGTVKNRVISGDDIIECNYNEKPVYYEFYNDQCFSFYWNEENTLNLDILNVSDKSERTIHIPEKSLNFSVLSDDSFIGMDNDLFIYDWINEQEIRTEISCMSSSAALIKTDSHDNIYVLYKNDDDRITLSKYNKKLEQLFSCSDYDDMSGNICDLNVDDKLIIVSYDQLTDIYYFNEINTENGNTVTRTEKDSVSAEKDFINSEDNELKFESMTKSGYSAIINDIEGNRIDRIEFITVNEDAVISKVYVDDSGDLFYIEESYNPLFISDDNTSEPKHIIHRIDASGEHSYFELKSMCETEFAKDLRADNDGHVYVIEKEDNICLLSVFDYSGKLVDQIEYNEIISYNSSVLCNNELYISYSDAYEQNKIKVMSLNNDSNNFEKIKTSYYTDVCDCRKPGILMLRSLNGITMLDVDKNEIKGEYNFSNIDISGYKLCYAFGDLFIRYNDSECYLFSAGKDKTRKEIKMAVSGAPAEILDNTKKFNNENEDCFITLVQYGYDENANTQLNLDMIQQKVDIIVSNDVFDVEEYDKEIFADLAPLISRDLETDEYVMNIFNLYSENDRIYEAVPFFNVECFTGFSDVVPNNSSWNVSDFIKFNHSEKTEFTYYNTYQFLMSQVYGFTDGSGTQLSAEKLGSVLKIVKENFTDYGTDDEIYPYSLWGSQINTGWSDDWDGRKLIDIPFPSDDKSGVLVSPDYGFSILNSSENKEEAWKFIKSMLMPEFQSRNQRDASGIPVHRKSWEKILKSAESRDESKKNIEKLINKADGKLISKYSKIGQLLSETIDKTISEEYTPDEAAAELVNKLQLYINERK